MGSSFCEPLAHIMCQVWFNGRTEHVCRTSLSPWNGVIGACLEFPPREQLTIWTWITPVNTTPTWTTGLQTGSPLKLTMCLDESPFPITEANIPENTEASVYRGDPLCLTVFKHLALQGYDWTSLLSWGFRPVILSKGGSNSFQDTDAPLSKDIEALGFWARLPSWRQSYQWNSTCAWCAPPAPGTSLTTEVGTALHRPQKLSLGFLSCLLKELMLLYSCWGFLDTGIAQRYWDPFREEFSQGDNRC